MQIRVLIRATDIAIGSCVLDVRIPDLGPVRRSVPEVGPRLANMARDRLLAPPNMGQVRLTPPEL